MPSNIDYDDLCTLEDVETYLRSAVPIKTVEYAERKIGASSDVLRRLFRNDGRDLDEIVDPTSEEYDALTVRQARDAVAVNVALDLKRVIANDGNDTDLDSFSTFTQSVDGISFSGTWQGNSEDVFFTANQLYNIGLSRPTIRRLQI